ncbi:MAG TPA: NfeD family protein [Pseudomonadales bacterium]|nr:NfeD family protein [Pseudomonadales bacterium]
MFAAFGTITYWHWFALGLLLLMVEMAGAGGYLLWVGLSAGLTGMVLWLVPQLLWQFQLVIFSVASVVMAIGWWQYQKHRPGNIMEPLLNKRSAQYVGRVFTLSDAIENGRGKIRVDDSFWEVSASHDLAAGTKVKVIAVEHDQIFLVEKYIQ